MAVPQIDAATCTIVLTLCLWAWTRLKLPEGCHTHESLLRQQNTHVLWAFSALIGLEVLNIFLKSPISIFFTSILSGLVFVGFAAAFHRKDGGFWSKKRNLAIGLTLTLVASMLSGLILVLPNLASVLSALAISHLCRKQFLAIIVASIKDLEALQAKILKQEAILDNIRNFDHYQIKKTS